MDTNREGEVLWVTWVSVSNRTPGETVAPQPLSERRLRSPGGTTRHYILYIHICFISVVPGRQQQRGNRGWVINQCRESTEY